MVNMQTNRSPLETEPLTKLLFRYSVPTTLTLMVNYIYNEDSADYVAKALKDFEVNALQIQEQLLA